MHDENSSAPPFATVQFTTDPSPGNQRERAIAGGTAIMLVCVASFWLALNPQWVMGLGHWGYLSAFIISLVASATIILPAPGIAVIIAMSTTLDPVLLGMVAGIGSAIGELSGYAAGAGGRALIPKSRRAQFEQLHQLTGRYGAWLLLLLSAIPFPLFDFAGIVAGMLRMNIPLFLAAVATGKSVKYIVMILLGAAPLLYLQQNFNLFGN